VDFRKIAKDFTNLSWDLAFKHLGANMLCVTLFFVLSSLLTKTRSSSGPILVPRMIHHNAYTHDSEHVKECEMDSVIEAQRGQQLSLFRPVKGVMGHVVTFRNLREDFGCCYSLTEKDCLWTKDKFESSKVKQRCPSINFSYFEDSRHNSTYSAVINSANEAGEGLYSFYDADAKFITACHLVLRESKSDIWKVAFFVLNSLSILIVLIGMFRLIFRRKQFCTDEERKVPLINDDEYLDRL